MHLRARLRACVGACVREHATGGTRASSPRRYARSRVRGHRRGVWRARINSEIGRRASDVVTSEVIRERTSA
eukprot:6201520-Pleurochrysis_carterae.AAC.1